MPRNGVDATAADDGGHLPLHLAAQDTGDVLLYALTR